MVSSRSILRWLVLALPLMLAVSMAKAAAPATHCYSITDTSIQKQIAACKDQHRSLKPVFDSNEKSAVCLLRVDCADFFGETTKSTGMTMMPSPASALPASLLPTLPMSPPPMMHNEMTAPTDTAATSDSHCLSTSDPAIQKQALVCKSQGKTVKPVFDTAQTDKRCLLSVACSDGVTKSSQTTSTPSTQDAVLPVMPTSMMQSGDATQASGLTPGETSDCTATALVNADKKTVAYKFSCLKLNLTFTRGAGDGQGAMPPTMVKPTMVAPAQKGPCSDIEMKIRMLKDAGAKNGTDTANSQEYKDLLTQMDACRMSQVTKPTTTTPHPVGPDGGTSVSSASTTPEQTVSPRGGALTNQDCHTVQAGLGCWQMHCGQRNVGNIFCKATPASSNTVPSSASTEAVPASSTNQ